MQSRGQGDGAVPSLGVASTMMAQVSIVVLSWNGLGDTLACLASLEALDYPARDVIVVDNGSTDGSAAALRGRSDITLIENGENLGFAAGNNVGLRHALHQGADYILLLNNDTEVASDSLRLLVEAAEADPAICAAGPMIYYHTSPQTIWSAGGSVDWRRGSTTMAGIGVRDVGQYGTTPRTVDFVTGCALLMRGSVLEQIGMLDERFFAYYEEAEWCIRASHAGYKVVQVPRSRIWHKIPLDARDWSPLVTYYMTRNRLLFLRCTRAGLRAWLYTLVAEYLRTLTSWTVKPRWRHRKEQRRMMWYALGDALRGHWGKRELAGGAT